MASGPRFTAHEREAKIAECSALYLSGKLQNEIAELLEVTQQQVSAYLKLLQKRWQVHAAEAIDARKARELARIDRVERETWEAWDISRQDAETHVARRKATTLNVLDGESVILLPAEEREYTLTARGQSGDPRFLQIVMSCIEMRLKIVGGFAPSKVEVYDWRKEAADLGLDPDALVDDFFSKVTDASSRAA